MYHFNLDRNYDISRSKNSCFLLNKNINCNKIKTISKITKFTHTLLQRLTFNSYKNHKLKVKLWQVQAHKRKKSAFFNIYFVWRKFFQHLHVKKHYFLNFLLVSEISKAFRVLFRIFIVFKSMLGSSRPGVPWKRRPATSLQLRDSRKCVFLWILQNFKQHLSGRTSADNCCSLPWFFSKIIYKESNIIYKVTSTVNHQLLEIVSLKLDEEQQFLVIHM